MNCDAETRLLISRYADGETRGAESARAARHLETCISCRHLVREWNDQRDLFTWAITRALPVGGDTMALIRPLSDAPHHPADARWFRLSRRPVWAWAFAAALGAVVIAGITHSVTLPPTLAGTAHGHSAPVVRLASGARLELGPETEVTRLGRREVRLNRGWVRADVHGGPITVRTRRMEVRDIGTRFQVATGKEADTVFVESGVVQVRRGGTSQSVARDQLLSVENDGSLHVAGFPAWKVEEDEQGRRPALDEPFAPDSAEGLEWRAGLRALATRYPDLRTAGGGGSSASVAGGREYAVRWQSVTGIRAGLRAHLPGLAAWMAGDATHVGRWDVPVAALGLPGPSADGTVPAGAYRLRLLATGGSLVWTLDQGGNAIVIPAGREPEIRSGTFTESATGRVAVAIDDAGSHDLVVQLLDWPGALKPTLRLPLAGQSIADARADLAPMLATLQTATSHVNAFESDLESSSVYYLDPTRRHYLLWAENRAGGGAGRLYVSRGSSRLAAALQSNVRWKTPDLPSGTYLLWLTWPTRDALPHWEMTTPDGTRRWALPVSEHLVNDPALAGGARLTNGAAVAITRSSRGKEGEALSFELGFHAMSSPGTHGGGTMRLAAP